MNKNYSVTKHSIEKTPEKGLERRIYDMKIVRQKVFNERIDKVLKVQKQDLQSRSISPGETRFSNLKKKTISKEDIFRNPSAVYLSRRQLSFGRQEMIDEKSKILEKSEKKFHVKTKSMQLPENSGQIFSKQTIKLVPIESLKNLSPKLRKKTSEIMKKIHCDALKQFSSLCDNSIGSCRKIDRKEKSVLKKYTDDINWLATISEDYGDYHPKIAKELIQVSQHSREIFEKERQDVVSQIRSGDFDPNINSFKIRALLRKKKQES